MAAEDITIPCSKYDWLWAWHDRGEKDKNSDRLAIMVHGFPGDHKSYADVFSDISAAFTKKGFHTLRFDMRGCGLSDKSSTFFSFQTAAEDCVTVLQWAEKLGYKKLYLIAEGLGAPVVLSILGDRIRPMIQGIIFLWPILSVKNSGLKQIVADQSALFGPTFRDEVEDYNFTLLMPRLTMPTMVLCGSEDTTAPPQSQAEILKLYVMGKNLDILTFEGGDHGLKTQVERQFLMNQISAFIHKIS